MYKKRSSHSEKRYQRIKSKQIIPYFVLQLSTVQHKKIKKNTILLLNVESTEFKVFYSMAFLGQKSLSVPNEVYFHFFFHSSYNTTYLDEGTVVSKLEFQVTPSSHRLSDLHANDQT